MKTLITNFSVQGTIAKVAKALAIMIDADLFEIRPEKPYTGADLKWTNPLARCNREMPGRKDVPVESRIEAFDQYDIVQASSRPSFALMGLRSTSRVIRQVRSVRMRK